MILTNQMITFYDKWSGTYRSSFRPKGPGIKPAAISHDEKFFITSNISQRLIVNVKREGLKVMVNYLTRDDKKCKMIFVEFDKLNDQMRTYVISCLSWKISFWAKIRELSRQQYFMMMRSFSSFQNIFQRLILDVKREKVTKWWQITLHRMIKNVQWFLLSWTK